jgi:hypothetical protein
MDDMDARLNRSFYDQDPTTYFRNRSSLLALRAVKGEELAGLLGFQWGNLYVGAEAVDRTPEEEEDLTTRFVVAESQVLLHHAAEAAVRLFLAHAANPACPWLEMAALLNFTEFRNHLDQLAAPVVPDSLRDGAAWVFLGRSPGNVDDQALEALEPSIRLIRALARRLHEDKTLYNAAKHGMTMVPGVGSFSIKTEDGQPVIAEDGTQVMYLERQTASPTEWSWHQTTRWVSPQAALMLTELALVLMDGIWSGARSRYLQEPHKGLKLVTAEGVDAVLHEFAKTSGSKFSLNVGRQERPPKRPKC